MGNELLNSMVSIRPTDQQQTHLGLGLFIANKIAEFHHGKIQIRNRDDQCGVEVFIRLPLSDR